MIADFEIEAVLVALRDEEEAARAAARIATELRKVERERDVAEAAAIIFGIALTIALLVWRPGITARVGVWFAVAPALVLAPYIAARWLLRALLRLIYGAPDHWLAR